MATGRVTVSRPPGSRRWQMADSTPSPFPLLVIALIIGLMFILRSQADGQQSFEDAPNRVTLPEILR